MTRNEAQEIARELKVSHDRDSLGYHTYPCQLFHNIDLKSLEELIYSGFRHSIHPWVIRDLPKVSVISGKSSEEVHHTLPFATGSMDYVVIILEGIVSAICYQKTVDWNKPSPSGGNIDKQTNRSNLQNHEEPKNQIVELPYYAAIGLKNDVFREFGLIAQLGGTVVKRDNYARVITISKKTKAICIPYIFFDPSQNGLSDSINRQLAWNLAGCVHSKILASHRTDQRYAGAKTKFKFVGTALILAGRFGTLPKKIDIKKGTLEFTQCIDMDLLKGLSRVSMSKNSFDVLSSKKFMHFPTKQSARTENATIDLFDVIPQSILTTIPEYHEFKKGSDRAKSLKLLKMIASKAGFGMCHPSTHPKWLEIGASEEDYIQQEGIWQDHLGH